MEPIKAMKDLTVYQLKSMILDISDDLATMQAEGNQKMTQIQAIRQEIADRLAPKI